MPNEEISKIRGIVKYLLNKSEDDIKALSDDEVIQRYYQIIDNNISNIEALQAQYNDRTGNNLTMLVSDLILWFISENKPMNLNV
nr:MAG TPA: hypothetical protein [Caudoviricetes sp.]